MTQFIVKKFINNYEKTEDVEVRKNYGTLSSIVGIICNIVLFVVKYVMGIISNSISIISDAFNNLSDCASCLISLFGYKLAAKPADKEHPFGHGRMEYVVSMIIAAVILLAAFELAKDSINKIINPEEVKFSIVVLVSLILSIIVKLWMAVFNFKLGKTVESSVMLATSKDSRNDVVATFATIISLIVSGFFHLSVDGIIGVVVSLFVFYSGLEIIKDTVNELLRQTYRWKHGRKNYRSYFAK
ncbi:MAG: cation diffusion facilitator family transporter [Clostridia bacterium]|nr:cation diffusion facilitator family transporter [Clostridia bacterium]